MSQEKKCGVRRSKKTPDVYTRQELIDIALEKKFTPSFVRKSTVNRLCLLTGINKLNFSTLNKRNLKVQDKTYIQNIALSLGLVSKNKLKELSKNVIIRIITDYVDYNDKIELIKTNIGSYINMLNYVDNIYSRTFNKIQTPNDIKKYLDDCLYYNDEYYKIDDLLLMLESDEFDISSSYDKGLKRKYNSHRKKIIKIVKLIIRTSKHIHKKLINMKKTLNLDQNIKGNPLKLVIEVIEKYILYLPEKLEELYLILDNKSSI